MHAACVPVKYILVGEETPLSFQLWFWIMCIHCLQCIQRNLQSLYKFDVQAARTSDKLYFLHLMASDKWTIKLQLVDCGALQSMALLFPILLLLVVMEYWGFFGFVFWLCWPTTTTTASPLIFSLACSLHSLNLVVLLLIADAELVRKQNSELTNSWTKAYILIPKTYLRICLNYLEKSCKM